MRTWALVVGVLVTGACVAGCGGSVLDPVASAATKTREAGTEHVTLDGAVKTGGVGVTMSGEGDFDNPSHKGRLHVAFVGGGLSGSMDEVVNELVLYLRSDVFSASLPPGKTWVKIDLQKAVRSLGLDLGALGGADPTRVLEQLEKTGSVTKIGEENIGVPATHYRAQIDLSKVPGGANLERLAHVTYGPTEVWVDRDGFVRRMHVSYGTQVTRAAQTRTTITMNFSRFGEPLSVSVPKDSATFDASNLAIPGIRA